VQKDAIATSWTWELILSQNASRTYSSYHFIHYTTHIAANPIPDVASMPEVVRTSEELNDAVEYLKERMDRFEKMATIQDDALLKWPGRRSRRQPRSGQHEFEEMVESLEWLTAQPREYKD
jgi:hypothetical protein